MSVTAAAGFRAAGVESGIKAEGLDIALVVAEKPAVTGAVFTQNQIAAAPVLLSRESLLRSSLKRGVVLNSGCANAATGGLGTENAHKMVHATATVLDVSSEEVLICSTGTIGPQLPMGRVVAGIGDAAGSLDGSASAGTRAATAIMTTDTVPKESVVQGGGWVVGGMAKGAGMIRPNMATMLAILTTDADVHQSVLDAALRSSVDATFNSLNIDGCESTNDTVIAMASGASGTRPDPVEFAAAMEQVCRDLVQQMARDAEGASRVVTIDVSGAPDDATARRLGRFVTDSALVRSSFYGGDPNGGRILGALGAAGVEIDPGAITITYQGVDVFADGVEAAFDEPALLVQMEAGDLEVGIRLGGGPGAARIVATDLTPQYVIFNGERS